MKVFLRVFLAILFWTVISCTRPAVPVLSLSFEDEELVLSPGESVFPALIVEPQNADYEKILWHSTNPAVAAVNSEGKVVGVSLGEAFVSASIGSIKAECRVSVRESGVEEIILSETDVELFVSETFALKATVPGDNSEARKIVWQSTQDDIVMVDSFGLITAVAAGTATVTASVDDVQAECRVIVRPLPVESLKIVPAEIELSPDEKFKLTATVQPEEALANTLTWKTSDDGVVQVDADGVLTGVAEGSAIVSVQCGEKTAECRITVMTNRSARIGDFYYDDGSVSGELDPAKKVIGIVFWTGNPAVHDKSLKRDCPDCSNGLVVALSETKDPCAWQNQSVSVGDWVSENVIDYVSIASDIYGEAPDYLNKMMGYNNTRAIMSFNESSENPSARVTAMDPILAYREEVPAPDSSSDWYLPSAKELTLLSCGEVEGTIWRNSLGTAIRDIVNPKIEEAGGVPLFEFLWSSTERSEDEAYLVWMDYGGVAAFPLKDTSDQVYVRAVLAF